MAFLLTKPKKYMPDPKKSKAGIIESERERPELPDWTKEKPTEKVHIYDARKKKIIQENKPKVSGVTRPKPWQPDDVLILKKK